MSEPAPNTSRDAIGYEKPANPQPVLDAKPVACGFCGFCGKGIKEVRALSHPNGKNAPTICNFCVNIVIADMASIKKALDVHVLAKALLAQKPPDSEAVATTPGMPKPPMHDGAVIDAEMVAPP